MFTWVKIFATLSLAISLTTHAAEGGPSADDINKSNNPLTPMLGLNFQDYIISSIYGMPNREANQGFVRGVMPSKMGGYPQILRMTIPYTTVPNMPSGSTSGTGDINLFDIFLLPSSSGIQTGVGPYLVFPTASKDETGSGKWQLGISGLVAGPETWGLWGALLTYQHDFAGDADRPTVNVAVVQPFIMYNLPHAFYLRSAGIWQFNWQTGNYYMPIGLGLGKVWKLESGTTINLFAEPQWTIAHQGDGFAEYQTYVGLNFQFPLGK